MAFFAAMGFLTILPVPASVERTESRQALYFPLVGLLIGGMAVALDQVCREFLFPEIRPVLVVLGLALITGGLHLDGLADAADGLFSHQDRERCLQIMRDPRLGTMGLLTLVFVLAVKLASVAALPASQAWIWLLAAPGLARSAQVAGLVFYDYARPKGEGQSRFFQKHRWDLLGLAWLPLLVPFVAGINEGLLAGFTALGIAWGFFGYAQTRLDGLTGDILGAGSELVETGLLFIGAWVSMH